VLFGYFQSPLYFECIADELRSELNGMISRGTHASCVHSSASYGSSLKSRLSEPNAVAVHVRRGDYLHHPVFNVCDKTYYLDALNQMRARLPNARFFIFSDDPEWCHAEFSDSDQEVVDSGDAAANPLHDLHLMSLASHHIIANSTYSWWAAWLGNKPGQQVIMPNRWYARDFNAPVEEKKLPHWEIITPS
jgi:hypothetical protein